MYKLSYLDGGKWAEHSFQPVFAQRSDELQAGRIVAGVPGGDPLIFERLASLLEPPYFLLYVLHTPRGEGEPGRYQSPELSNEQLWSFIARFHDYLRSDARFDVWAYSPSEQATVVWERHNQVFAYGPSTRFASELRALGYQAGQVEVPTPHQHHYRQEYDAQAAELLSAIEWSYSPLRREDEQ